MSVRHLFSAIIGFTGAVLLFEQHLPLAAVLWAAGIVAISWAYSRGMRQSSTERELLERLTLATTTAGLGVWDWDLTADEITTDDNTAQVYGLVKIERMSNATHFLERAIYPEDLPAWRAAREAAIASGEHAFHRYRVVRPGGALRHMNMQARVFRSAEGKAIRILAMTSDVTDEVERIEHFKRQAEQERELLDRLNLATHSAGIAVWDKDIETGRSYSNPMLWQLLGLPEKHGFAASTFKDVTHPEDREKTEAALFSALENAPADQVVALRHRIVRVSDGQVRHVQVHRRILRNAAGKATRVVGVAWDVSDEIKQSEQERMLLERLKITTEAADISSWEIDLKTRRFVWWDRRHPFLSHVPAQEHAAEEVEACVHPDDRQNLLNGINHAIATNTDFMAYRVRLLSADGRIAHLQQHVKLLFGRSGKPVRALGVGWEVTKEVEAAEKLTRTMEEAQAANVAKNAFLANVSHEIRTPMNGIIGMTALLLESALDRTQRDYGETIRSSAESLMTVINDLLDFSKIEAGKIDIEEIEMDLRGNVEDVGTTMAFQAAAKGLELVVNVRPEVAERVMGDPQRIRQCLINLVGNAIKFTPAGEVIIEVGAEQSDGRIRFEVRDTGIGIAPQVQATLFQPFVQADSSTTRHFGGTGLGLSIVRRLVEMMGGEVGMQSETGKGSTFWFTLALQAVAAKAQPPRKFVAGHRVLVVDDNAANRKVMEGHLSRAGYDVMLAGNGNEALMLMHRAMGENRPYEAVLADFQMPDMDGAMLGEIVNANPDLSRARLIMLTSMDRHGDMRRLAAMGFAAYIQKPIRGRELLACLERVLAKDAREWHSHHEPLLTRSRLQAEELERRYRGNILLVEDNLVNQKVAQRFLERLGCEVTIANHGAEALTAVAAAVFDLVLMDLQMPYMDGFTATRRIRETEADSSRHIPIVALTANAMTGQYERCIESGMDGFLTKPLALDRLREVLDQYVQQISPTPPQASDSKPREESAVSPIDEVAGHPLVDLARLDEITGGDPQFTQELLATFISSGEEVLAEVTHYYEQKNRAQLARSAHKLKGASANIYAEQLKQRAAQLESQAEVLPLPEIPPLIEALRTMFHRTCGYLQNARPAEERMDVAN